MTRQQTNKTKVDRSKTRSETPNTRSLFGGKLEENDWNELLDEEESEQIVNEYIHDLLNVVLEKAYRSYLTRQLIPFTVFQASEAILKLAELEFVEADPGDCITSPEWLEDKLPAPCKIDSWAQGAMSKHCELSILQRARSTERTDAKMTSSATAPHKVKTDKGFIIPEDVAKKTKKPKKSGQSVLGNKTEISREAKRKKLVDSKSMLQQQQQQQKPKQTVGVDNDSRKEKSTSATHQERPLENPNPRQSQDSGVRKQSAENAKLAPEITTNKTIMQQRRFAGSERFTFDDEGNLISVPRLVSTPTKANRANKQAVLHEQPADRLGSIADTVGVKWRVVPTAPNGDQLSMGDLTDVTTDIHQKKSSVPAVLDSQLLKRTQHVKSMATGLFTVLDQIEPMPGVSVTDGERTRTGPEIDENVNETQAHKLDELKGIRRTEYADNLLIDAATTSAVSRLSIGQILKIDAIQIVNSAKTGKIC